MSSVVVNQQQQSQQQGDTVAGAAMSTSASRRELQKVFDYVRKSIIEETLSPAEQTYVHATRPSVTLPVVVAAAASAAMFGFSKKMKWNVPGKYAVCMQAFALSACVCVCICLRLLSLFICMLNEMEHAWYLCCVSLACMHVCLFAVFCIGVVVVCLFAFIVTV
jgi:hypothetical protein